MRKRHRARKVMLDVLYRLELESVKVETALESYTEELMGAGIEEFTRRELNGILEHRAELDKTIDEYADRWSLSRMPVLDRNILRMGLYEILHEPDIPPSVSINEAVELANVYSTEDSGRFINGILGRIAKDIDKIKT